MAWWSYALIAALPAKALQMAPASRVAPIDKVSLAFTILLAGVVLGEPISWKVGLGIGQRTPSECRVTNLGNRSASGRFRGSAGVPI